MECRTQPFLTPKSWLILGISFKISGVSLMRLNNQTEILYEVLTSPYKKSDLSFWGPFRAIHTWHQTGEKAYEII